MVDPVREKAIGERAEKALRTPDLEWARDLVHGLANDVIALLAVLQDARTRADELASALWDAADANPWTHGSSIAQKACDRLGVGPPAAALPSGKPS